MVAILDEFKHSFPINVWSKLLYDGVSEFHLDIYYSEKGFPAVIHDAFGNDGINGFRNSLVSKISTMNSTNDIWRVASDAFAVVSKASNCGGFDIIYKGVCVRILKKTVLICQVCE